MVSLAEQAGLNVIPGQNTGFLTTGLLYDIYIDSFCTEYI